VKRVLKTLFILIFSLLFFSLPATAQSFEDLCAAEGCARHIERIENYGNQGDTSSMLLLAVIYANGEGTAVDHKKASMWMREAIRLGSGHAAYVKALWRRQGIVFDKDLQRAEWLIDRAIRLKHPEAMYDRALRLIEQEHTANDGLDLLHAAADLGMQQATYLLARFLEEGVVTARDPVAAGLLFGELSLHRYKDSSTRLNSIITLLADDAETDAAFIDQLTTYKNMEVITVVGHKNQINALENLHNLLGERFYQPSTGSNIRRQRACNAGGGCRVIYDRKSSTPAGDRLSEVLGHAR